MKTIHLEDVQKDIIVQILTSYTLHACGGTVAGFTIDATEGIYSGTGATRVQMKPGAGFWAGATARDSAPFYVTQAGLIHGTNLDLKTATSGARLEINSSTNQLTYYSSTSDSYYTRIGNNIYGANYSGIACVDNYGHSELVGSTLNVQASTTVQFNVSVNDYVYFTIKGLPTTATVGGSDWHILYVNDAGQVARQV
jgi:hypothetical protein